MTTVRIVIHNHITDKNEVWPLDTDEDWKSIGEHYHGAEFIKRRYPESHHEAAKALARTLSGAHLSAKVIFHLNDLRPHRVHLEFNMDGSPVTKPKRILQLVRGDKPREHNPKPADYTPDYGYAQHQGKWHKVKDITPMKSGGGAIKPNESSNWYHLYGVGQVSDKEIEDYTHEVPEDYSEK